MKQTYFKEKKYKEEEYLEELEDKVSFKIKDLPNPQPVTYNTFDKYARIYSSKDKQKSKKKSKFISSRFRSGRKDTFRRGSEMG